MAVVNNLASVIPTLYAQGLDALRSALIMPRLVLNDFGTEVKQRGEVIQIPLPSNMTTTTVVPAAYAPDPQNIAPTTATIPLDNWEESAFTLTDKEYAQVVAGVVPIQLSAAVQALAAAVNQSIFNNYVYIGNSTGTAGTTPFQANVGIAPATNAGVVLDNNLALQGERFLALSPAAYGQAEQLPNFAYAMYAGDTETVRAGVIRDKFGFDWHKDQQIPYQTAGTLTGAVTANGAQAEGVSAVSISTAAGASFAPNVGDLITFAGDAQTYTVLPGGVASAPLGASASGVVNILPEKAVALKGGEAISITPSHVVNLAFQRQAFGFASRPTSSGLDLARDGGGPVVAQMEVPDPVSGLTMQMQVRNEYHRTRVAYSMLWGTGVVRPQVACRILG